MPAPADQVMRALTDAGALRIWLAEHAEVELPDRFEFWGRFTPAGDAAHQRLLHADERTLRFNWLLDGVDPTTEITLDDGEGSGGPLPQPTQSPFSRAQAVSGSSSRGGLRPSRALSIANLNDYLAGRELTPKCDYTSTELVAEIDIGAAREDVFDSLVNKAKFSQWFGYPVDIEAHVGGRFAMGGFDNDPNPAKIVELVPGVRAAIDFGGIGVASWELADSGGKTRITFVQSGFDTASPPHAAWAGWLAGTAELRRFHEVARWRPIWLDASVLEPADRAAVRH